MWLAHIDTGGYDIYGVGETESDASSKAYKRWYKEFVSGAPKLPGSNIRALTSVEANGGGTSQQDVEDYYGIYTAELIDGTTLR